MEFLQNIKNISWNFPRIYKIFHGIQLNFTLEFLRELRRFHTWKYDKIFHGISHWDFIWNSMDF